MIEYFFMVWVTEIWLGLDLLILHKSWLIVVKCNLPCQQSITVDMPVNAMWPSKSSALLIGFGWLVSQSAMSK